MKMASSLITITLPDIRIIFNTGHVVVTKSIIIAMTSSTITVP